jgi:hypothetical protein
LQSAGFVAAVSFNSWLNASVSDSMHCFNDEGNTDEAEEASEAKKTMPVRNESKGAQKAQGAYSGGNPGGSRLKANRVSVEVFFHSASN